MTRDELMTKIAEALQASHMALGLHALSTATGSSEIRVERALDQMRASGSVKMKGRRFALKEDCDA